MDTIALLSHASPTAIVAYRSGLAVTAQQFLDDANQAARGLSRSKHVLNVCADRYQFTVGLAACLMSERVSLLPSTHTPQVIAQLKAFAPDACCLTDETRCDIDLPQIYYPDLFPRPAPEARAEPRFEVPRIPSARLAAIVLPPARPARRCLIEKPGDCWRAAFRTARRAWGCWTGEATVSWARFPASTCTALNRPCCSRC